MGRDKRGILIGGVPTLRRALAALASASTDLMLVTRHDRPPDPTWIDGIAVRIVHDRMVDGPLAGIEAALTYAHHELVIVVAADMPWLQPSLLRLLVRRASEQAGHDAVLPVSDRGPEPLLAVYRRRVATPLRVLAESGERRASALLGVIEADLVPPAVWRRADPDGISLRNLNQPVDIAALDRAPARSTRR
jgi:molybdopterin-guanine dinucleotide biosynthesis protein A